MVWVHARSKSIHRDLQEFPQLFCCGAKGTGMDQNGFRDSGMVLLGDWRASRACSDTVKIFSFDG